MTQAMRIRATLQDGAADVRALIYHDMETGLRKDAASALIPAWYITEVTASLNGKAALKVHWGPAISRNPLLQFKLRGAKVGDRVTLHWVDNKGGSRTDEATVG